MFTQKDLSVAFKCFAQVVTKKNKNQLKEQKSHVLHFSVITLEVNL